MLSKYLFSIIFIISLSSQIYAHPHTWINLQSTFGLNENAELIEIKQKWQFDEFYSAMFIADMLNEFGPDRDLAFTLAGENMVSSLSDYQYFSNLTVDQVGMSIGQPSEYLLTSEIVDGAEMLTMFMTFTLASTPNIKDTQIEWSVFDPTYYVAMIHTDIENLAIENGQNSGCMVNMDIPEPSQETIAYASSLDKEQTETQGLGILFAEKIRFGCL